MFAVIKACVLMCCLLMFVTLHPDLLSRSTSPKTTTEPHDAKPHRSRTGESAEEHRHRQVCFQVSKLLDAQSREQTP